MTKSLWESATTVRTSDVPGVRMAVPFFRVRNMDASLRFYVDGLGFVVARQWVPDGRIRWCWLERGGAALMLQEFWKKGEHGDSPGPPEGPLGQGMSICFICDDAIAIYNDALAKGLAPSSPFVGNAMWVISIADPDGFRVEFESPTDVPEGTRYQGESA